MLKRDYYRERSCSEKTKELAEEILGVLLKSGATYSEADDALGLAQEKLSDETMPVKTLNIQKKD